MFRPTDKTLSYYNRERNYIRSQRAELRKAWNHALPEPEKTVILRKLENLDHLTEHHHRDPTGSWRSDNFQNRQYALRLQIRPTTFSPRQYLQL